MYSDQEIEKEIVDKGLTAPRITPDILDGMITASAYHVFPTTTMTVCCLTLTNGFNTIGHSSCASPRNFNAEIGKAIALRNAKQEIWALGGYLLKEKLFQGNM